MYGHSNGRRRLLTWLVFQDDDEDWDRRGLVWSCPSSLMRLEVDDVADAGFVVDLLHGHAGLGLCRSGCFSALPQLVHVHVLLALWCVVFLHGHCWMLSVYLWVCPHV